MSDAQNHKNPMYEFMNVYLVGYKNMFFEASFQSRGPSAAGSAPLEGSVSMPQKASSLWCRRMRMKPWGRMRPAEGQQKKGFIAGISYFFGDLS